MERKLRGRIRKFWISYAKPLGFCHTRLDKHMRIHFVLAILTLPMTASAQLQVATVPLQTTDTFVNLKNTGTDNICINTYVFDAANRGTPQNPIRQMLNCCSALA